MTDTTAAPVTAPDPRLPHLAEQVRALVARQRAQAAAEAANQPATDTNPKPTGGAS